MGLKRSQLSRVGKTYETDLLKAKIDFLSFKIERSHLKRVFMTFITDGRPLPEDTKRYGIVSQMMDDSIMYRVLVERDKLNDIYWMNHGEE